MERKSINKYLLLIIGIASSALVAIVTARWEEKISADQKMSPQGFSEQVVDFGIVRQQSHFEAIAHYNNYGESQCIVSVVDTSCHCTTAKLLGAKTMRPGDVREVLVGYNSGRAEGPVRTSVVLQTATDYEPSSLDVKAWVTPPNGIYVPVDHIDCGAFSLPPTRQEHEVTISGTKETLKNAILESNCLAVSVKRGNLAEQTAFPGIYDQHYIISVYPSIGSDCDASICVKTRDEQIAQFPISWQWALPHQVIPCEVFFGRKRKGEVLTKTIEIEEGGPITVVSDQFAKGLRVSAQKSHSDIQEVIVKFYPGAKSGGIQRGNLTFFSNNGAHLLGVMQWLCYVE